MPRKNLIKTNQYPYHVTIRSNNREWFDLPMEEVWSYCVSALSFSSKTHEAKVQAFVLMANHYHLMIWTPKSNLDQFMWSLNSQISKSIRQSTGRINRIFGDRYKWSLIKTEAYYLQALKYIYLNPVKAGITNKCEEYRYSSLYHLFNDGELSFPLFNPILGDKENFLEWINEKYTDEQNKKISIAIRRPIYKEPVTRSSRKKP